MRYRLPFGAAFGLLAAGLGLVAWSFGGVGRVALGWASLSLAGTGLAYLINWTGAFGKRADGTMGALHVVLWWPFLLFVRLVHEAQRLLMGEAPSDEVAPGLWVGRRPRGHELPAAVALVVDLCAELPAAPGVAGATSHRYLASPTLDATSPLPVALAEVVAAILDAEGPVLVHCAAGHGRSAAVAAAAAIARGDFPDLPAAERRLRERRRWIRLNREQRRAIEAFVRARRAV